jgi:hypothetical protein
MGASESGLSTRKKETDNHKKQKQIDKLYPFRDIK